MATDPLLRLAQQRTIEAAEQLQLQLEAKAGSAPAILIWARLRERAAEAMVALITVNFEDPGEIPKAVQLQNEIKRYDEWAVAMSELLAEGKAEAQKVAEDAQEEMYDVLTQTEEGREEAIELGIADDIPRD